MEGIFQNLSDIKKKVEELELFLEPTNPLSTPLLQATKNVFDLMKNVSNDKSSGLYSLLINGLDDEQIWQEIELETDVVLPYLSKKVNEYAKDDGELHISTSSRENGTGRKRIDKEKSLKIVTNEPVAFATEDEDDNTEDHNEPRSNGDNTSSSEEANSETESREDISLQVPKTKAKKRKKGSVIDDMFFNLEEMNTLADTIDVDANDNESEEEIDYFSADLGNLGMDGESDEERPLMYSDFFDPPEGDSLPGKKVQLPSKKLKISEENISDFDEDAEDVYEEADEMENGTNGLEDEGSEAQSEDAIDEDSDDNDDDDDEDEDEEDEDEEEEIDANDEDNDNKISKVKLSKYEREKLKMEEKIKTLEGKNLEAKPWQEKGEATAKQRPINSLLEETLEFKHASVGDPVVTEETTSLLEDIIKQRIKDQAWDDVLRKEKKVLDVLELKKQAPIDDEKSKLSLAEIYEKEYLKSTEKKGKDEEEEKEKEEHVAIKGMLKRLFMKLDALSNFHYKPKPVKEDLEIISNVPSIRMEEVAPVMVSETVHLAPEEIFNKSKTETKGTTEKTPTDKKRERRAKKLKKKREVEERRKKKEITSGKKVKTEEKKELLKSLSKNRRTTILNDAQDNKHLKSSTAVFTRLQDEAKNYVKGKSKETKGSKKSQKYGASAVKL